MDQGYKVVVMHKDGKVTESGFTGYHAESSAFNVYNQAKSSVGIILYVTMFSGKIGDRLALHSHHLNPS